MRIAKILLMMALLLAAIEPAGARGPAQQEKSGAKTRSAQSDKEKMKTDSKDEPIFMCRLDALNATERARHKTLRAQVQDKIEEIKELPDGYGFRLPSDSATILSVAEWITFERRCCEFFSFALEIEGENQSAWLRITGREGVKVFLQSEMGIK